jgi:hypothetical protein
MLVLEHERAGGNNMDTGLEVRKIDKIADRLAEERGGCC